MTPDLDDIEARAKALYDKLYSLEPDLSDYETDYLLRGAIPALIGRVRQLEAELVTQRKIQAITERQLDDEREAHAETFQTLVDSDWNQS